LLRGGDRCAAKNHQRRREGGMNACHEKSPSEKRQLASP
jgi:hypothetical protein